MNTTTFARGAVLLGAVTVGSLGLTACSDDDGATHDEFIAAACERFGTIDPGFEAFFGEHPEPTLEDWAAFLPNVIDAFDEMIATTKLPHPKADDANLADARAAMEKVQDNFRQALEAATTGDQATMDTLEASNQNVDVPAMEAAMQAVDPRDCQDVTG